MPRNQEGAPRKPGRPTKYAADTAKQAAKLCALGATDSQLADFFEVSLSTINLWKVEHKDFSDALKGSKVAADERVEQSLYRRAMGYEHDEVDIRVIAGTVVQTAIRKHYPPDTTACIFWLKNRQPDQWRDKQPEGSDMTPEEVARSAQEAIAAAMATNGGPG